MHLEAAMNGELALLTSDELRVELQRAEQELEDLEEERMMILGQTGVHIGAKELNRLTSSFTRDEARIRARIAEVASLLEQAR
jgi:hypothetical protein